MLKGKLLIYSKTEKFEKKSFRQKRKNFLNFFSFEKLISHREETDR